MIHSDWHIHTDASYDAKLPLETLIAAAKEQDLRGFGVTDHLNYPISSFWGNIRQSAENYRRLKAEFPRMLLGVELTPIPKPEYDHNLRTDTWEGYAPSDATAPCEIAMTGTKEELMALGIQYAVGAAHWRTNVPYRKHRGTAQEEINDWHQQQMFLACDERVTILGHPWNCNDTWYGDFSIVPASMHDELGAALLEHGKYVECNAGVYLDKSIGERFRHQYSEFLRQLFEWGVPITYGSDCHGKPVPKYPDYREIVWKYLEAAGFRDGDFSELAPEKLWQ